MGSAARFSIPQGLTLDGAGNIYVADTGNNIIRKITVDGVVSTLAGVTGISGKLDGTAATATFANPSGVTLDATGNVYVADAGNHRIRKVTPAGVVTTLAGRAGVSGLVLGTLPGTLNQPVGMVIDANGLLYTTSENVVLKIQLQ